MGRRKTDRSDKIIIGFESTVPLKIRLEEEAKRRYMSLSALIREILEKHYELIYLSNKHRGWLNYL